MYLLQAKPLVFSAGDLGSLMAQIADDWLRRDFRMEYKSSHKCELWIITDTDFQKRGAIVADKGEHSNQTQVSVVP